jgi:hypothetical protein
MKDASLLDVIGCLSLDLLVTITVASVSLYALGYAFFLIEYWGPMYDQTHGYVATVFFQVPKLLSAFQDHQNPFRGFWPLWFYPAFFTSVWLWLYAGAGFLLRASRRFDLGFEWFNRKFDIEKKPLQAIGLVAGTVLALVWWSAAIIGHIWK